MSLAKLALTGILAVATSVAAAQSYPDRPVRIVAPTSPGTGTDASARFIADQLAREWKVPVVVENKPGANTILGANMVAKADPDGYTLLMGLSAIYINKSLYENLPFDPVNDFRVVMGVNDLYLALVVPANSPVNSVQELIDYAKAHPKDVTYASAGSGSTTHLGPALFGSMAGLDLVHVPYKGGAQAITDTISGQVDFAVTAIATAAPHVASGRLKALAVTGKQRAKSLPDVPTMAESGLPGYEVSSRTFIAAPSGTPDAVVDKIVAAVSKIVQTPEYQKFLEAQGFEPETVEPAAYQKMAAAEVEHWRKIVAVSGAKVN